MATGTTTAPYGSWKSPLTADAVASGSSSVSMARVDQANPTRVYWLESRPQESGRLVLLSKDVDDYSERTLRELTADTKWNVRTAVHEYGGGAYAVHGGLVVFANWSDQGVYLVDTNKQNAVPVRIGEQNDKLRYASFVVHPSKKFVLCVREDHRESDTQAPATLVAIKLPSDGGADGQGKYSPTSDVVLFDKSDFVSSPAVSPMDDEISFYAWNHPDMNWDATTLYCASVDLGDDGVPRSLVRLRVVAGAPGELRESIYQPRFDEDGILHFISDRSGFWNPYYLGVDGEVRRSLGTPISAEFAGPEWAFGESTLQPVPGLKFSAVVTYSQNGILKLGILNVATHAIEDLPVPGWSSVGSFQLGQSHSGEQVLVLIAGGPAERLSLFTYYINGMSAKQLAGSKSFDDPYSGFVSTPQEIAFPTKLPPFGSAESQNAEAYAYYYPPTNKNYQGPSNELPPLLVLSHGGPTAAASTVLQTKIQYWTSRGIAVADVNYGGSTGYGREYRERLYPHFGEVDVQDCCAAALYLADSGLVDRKRLSIMGGSAGGFTTLGCLAFRPEVFAVGASLYGISDLEVLIKETHKFEAEYPVHLVGPYPEARAEYIRRSPLHSVDSLACPAIFLQGLEDKVVPPNQATLMVDALKSKGIRVAHIEFEGEQHGFRKSENIVRALEAQLYFFGRILGFEPADHINPVPIFNDQPETNH
ncbi:Esterase lipase thioesterase active site [Coemansia erecta]|nr:Esterase lipase thioesterase active site [Coemansia sp. RSA 2618]KAJ2822157.1 Esterase lipase thioesterase active site [Coemansia erecta]